MYREIKTTEDIDKLVPIAYEIWNHHFGQYFDNDTLAKLIDGVQSKTAILKDLDNNYKYFFINENDIPVGYFAYKILDEENELFLNKLYIYSSQRGKGVGRKVLMHLEETCRASDVKSISLTVFSGNTNLVKAYEKWGFENLGLIKKVFSEDLVFDDFKMRKKVG